MSEMAVKDIDAALERAPSGRRAKMLDQVTTLFIERADIYSEEEIGFFDDVIARLAAEIETEARILLAERLARVPRAPSGVIRMLAFDDDAAVASPVLMLSERLDEATLIENARAKSQRHLLAITRRRSLSEALTDVLVARGDRAVAVSLVANPGAKLSHGGFAALIGRVDGDDELAEGIGARRDIPPHLFLKLLAVASERVRTKLRALHPQAGADINRVVAQVAGRMKKAIAARPRDYTDVIEQLAARHRAGALSEEVLAGFAEAGRMEESVVALALIGDLPIIATDNAMHSDRSEALLVIARARVLSWPTVKALLRLRAGPKGISATELQQNLAGFERLSRATAEQLLRFHYLARSSPAGRPS